MQRDRTGFETIPQLRQFIAQTLCHQNDFEVGVFQITERVLTKKGNPCGIFFCLHGPRSVKLTAVWDCQNNTVLFYGSTGERFLKTELESSPMLVSA